MAKAYKCDCCGQFYVGSPVNRLVMGEYCTDNGGYFKKGAFLNADICPSCVESIKHFIKSKDSDHKSVFEDKEDVVMSKSGRVFIE